MKYNIVNINTGKTIRKYDSQEIAIWIVNWLHNWTNNQYILELTGS